MLGIALFTYQQFQAETWRSGLRDDEIHSATVEHVYLDGKMITTKLQLSKLDTIRLVRLAEKCPLGERNTGLGSCMPCPGPVSTSVELKLSDNQMFWILKIGDHLRMKTGEDVYIGSKRNEFATILKSHR